MSEENGTSPPSGYREIPRRAGSSVWEEAMAITAVAIVFISLLFCFGILLVISWPWGFLITLGVLNLYGAVVFVLLHRRNSE